MKVGPQNLHELVTTASALGPLSDEVVFVGGAIVALLLDDPAAEVPRHTDDVDLIVEVATTMAYQTILRDKLVALGFREDTSPRAPLCRWTIHDINIDIMPVAKDILGFNNRWYPHAFKTSRRVPLRPGLEIRVIT